MGVGSRYGHYNNRLRAELMRFGSRQRQMSSSADWLRWAVCAPGSSPVSEAAEPSSWPLLRLAKCYKAERPTPHIVFVVPVILRLLHVLAWVKNSVRARPCLSVCLSHCSHGVRNSHDQRTLSRNNATRGPISGILCCGTIKNDFGSIVARYCVPTMEVIHHSVNKNQYQLLLGHLYW
jgi:hypothetical protein